MNNTTENKQLELNMSGFKESINQTEIVLIDVTKLTPQNPPTVFGEQTV